MKQLDRQVAPPVREYGRLLFPQPARIVVPGSGGGEVEIVSFNRCPEPVCRVSVVWPAGLMDCDFLPLATMSVAALREGSGSRSASDISSDIESNGAWLAAETVQEFSALHLYALNRRIRPVLDVLADIICNPAFHADRVAQLRARQADAVRQNRCKVAYMADQAFRPLMTGADHLRSRVASPEMIESVDPSQLSAYWTGFIGNYRPTVWVAGNVTPDVMEALRDFASQLPAMPAASASIGIKEPYSPSAPCQVKTLVAEARQAAIAMGMPLPGVSHPDHMLLRTAVVALGGYFGSRLNSNIREDKGLTYGIGAGVRMSPQGAYLFIQAQADDAYVDRVIEETAVEIRRLVSEPLSSQEIIAVRRNQQSRLAGMLDSPFATLDYSLAMQQTGAGIDFFDRSQDALDFNSDDIARVASLYLNPDNMSVSIAGNL